MKHDTSTTSLTALLATAMLMAAPATLTAQQNDSTHTSLSARMWQTQMPSADFGAELYLNPAMQSYRYSASINRLQAGMDYSKASRPARLEDGTGSSTGYGSIDAYLHKGKATLWGNAAYRNGTTRNVRFSETTDYQLLYPYLMADTVGGNTHGEYYHFMGGFSYPLGRWNIAAEGEYTARMEFRTRDPRPKNLSGNLMARIGVSTQVGTGVMGMAVSARRYKQTNEVKLYNEVSVPTIYHLTGMGNDYYRFRGSNTSTYYQGHSLGGMLSYRQRCDSQRGAFAQAGYEFTEIEKIISSLNELPLATLRLHRQDATAGWLSTVGRHTLGLRLSEEWQRRQGFEHIFGTAQDNIYPQIAIAEMYRLTTLRIGADALWQHALPIACRRGYWALQAGTAYCDYHEEYAEPYRQLRVRSWQSALTLTAAVESRHMLTRLQATASRTWHTDARADRIEGTMATPVMHAYETLAHTAWSTGAALETSYKASPRFHPFVRADWRYSRYAQTAHGMSLTLAAGIYF